MKLIIFFQFFVNFLVLSTGLDAQPEKANKIGFALSGGGAKGLAHIGVLKVLEAEGIYPDYISGTSMGSVIGGLYAIGYSADFLDSLARAMDWNNYFSDRFDRKYLSIEEKNYAERYFATFPLEDKKIQLPKGFVDGQKLGLLLDQLTIPVHSLNDFDEFPIPFRCVATDLETGEAVVFKSGFLPEAIRASIGIPSVFEPLEFHDTLLVDGGVVRNVPVVDAENMGADYVIAFNVGASLYSKKELNSIVQVLDQTSSYRIVESNLEQLGKADLVISPDIAGYKGLDFSQVDSLIAIGEQAARRMLPELKKDLNAIGYKYFVRKNKTLKIPEAVKLHSIEVYGVDEAGRKTLLNLLQIKLPDVLPLEKLNEKFSRVAASGFYKKVDYRLLYLGDGYTLVVQAKKSGGKQLKLGANYDSDFNGALLLNATFRNLGLKGSKMSADMRISQYPALIFEYLVYTKTRPNLGLKLTGLGNFFPGSFYENNQLYQEFNNSHGKVELDLFSGLSKDLSFSLGLYTEYLSQKRKFPEDSDASEKILRQTATYARLTLDTYNRKYFPLQGNYLSFYANLVLDGSVEHKIENGMTSSVDLNNSIQLEYSQVFRLAPGLTALWFNYGGITIYETAEFINLFYLGRRLSYEPRFVPFTGFKYMQQPADQFGFSGIRIQAEPFDGKFISLDYNIGYFHAPEFILEENGGPLEIPEAEGMMSGMGLELGLSSTFGPVIFRSEFNFETRLFNFIFQIGFEF